MKRILTVIFVVPVALLLGLCTIGLLVDTEDPVPGYAVALEEYSSKGTMAILDSIATAAPAGESSKPEATREASATSQETKRGRSWSTSISTDPMTGEKTRQATLRSENAVHFDFPYGGKQHGTLIVRDHPQYGKDVIFKIERGQILCDAWSGANMRCPVKVRFGDGGAASWTAMPPADHGTETIFSGDYGEFVSKMQNVDTVRIQINVYQEGAPTFTFDVSQFDRSHYQDESE